MPYPNVTCSEPEEVLTCIRGWPVVDVAIVQAYGVLLGTVVVELTDIATVPTLRARVLADPVPIRADPPTDKSDEGEVVPIPTAPPLVAKYAEPVEERAVVDAYGIVVRPMVLSARIVETVPVDDVATCATPVPEPLP